MRDETLRLKVAVAALFVLASCTGPGAGDRPASNGLSIKAEAANRCRKSGEKPRNLLAVEWSWANRSFELARRDAVSLKEVEGSRVPIGENTQGASLSPDGSLLALGSRGTMAAEIQIIDVEAMRAVGGSIDLGGSDVVPATKWIGNGKLLALTHGRKLTSYLIDLRNLEVVESDTMDGTLLSSDISSDSILALIGPSNSIGPVTVVAVDRSGRFVTSGELPITGGFETRRQTSVQRTPAFAVDAFGGRAFVYADDSLVEVALEDMSIEKIRLDNTSFLERLAAFFVGQAHAKEGTGDIRQAVWMGDGTLAVFGFDHEGEAAPKAVGLSLIDVDSGDVSVVDESASAASAADGRVLAFDHTAQRDGPKDPDTEGIGVVAYDRKGKQLWHALGRRYVADLKVIGCYAYVDAPWRDRQIVVLDVRTGEVVGTKPILMPGLIAQ